jgi:hypothetical protein
MSQRIMLENDLAIMAAIDFLIGAIGASQDQVWFNVAQTLKAKIADRQRVTRQALTTWYPPHDEKQPWVRDACDTQMSARSDW